VSLGLFFFIVFLGHKIKKRFSAPGIRERIDTFLGGLIGLLKGILIVSLLIFLTATIPDWLPLKGMLMDYAFERSKIFPIIYRYNPLSFINVYKICSWAAEDNELLSQIEDEKIREMLENDRFMEAAMKKDYLWFFNNPESREIAKDHQLLKEIIKFNIRTAISKMTKKDT
jgi:hypothetical protein